MTMENSGHEQTKPAVDNVQPPAAENVPNPSRRRFNRAGVGASAVVMTLASRSVLANMACTTPSGFYSANMSHHGKAEAATVQCRGLDPNGWMTIDRWDPPRTKEFTKAFGTIARDNLTVGTPVSPLGNQSANNNGNGAANLPSSTLKLQDATLEQAIYGIDTPPVVKHLIAALLNASRKPACFATGSTPPRPPTSPGR